MEENTPLESADSRHEFKYEETLSVLWASRGLIGKITGSVTAAAIVVSFLLPPYFSSTVVILPEASQSKLAALGGLSDLASLAGVNVGAEASPTKLYPVIVKSEAVLKNVIYRKYQTKAFPDSVNLVQLWDGSEGDPRLAYESVLRELRDELDVSLDSKTNVLTVSLFTKEPQLSADIVNAIAHELDVFSRTKRTTNASAQRKWIEGRLMEVKADLERSENALKDFRETNRRVSDSPELLLEQGRFIREVEINSALFTELKKQFEVAKIEEIKNVPIVNIMDAGRPAAKNEKPKKTVITIVFFVLSLFGGIGFAFARVKYADTVAVIRNFLTLKLPYKAKTFTRI